MRNNKSTKETITEQEPPRELTLDELKARAFDIIIEIKRLENLYQAVQTKIREKQAEQAN